MSSHLHQKELLLTVQISEDGQDTKAGQLPRSPVRELGTVRKRSTEVNVVRWRGAAGELSPPTVPRVKAGHVGASLPHPGNGGRRSGGL